MSEDTVDLIIHAPSRSIFDVTDGVWLLAGQTPSQWQSLYNEEIKLDSLELSLRGATPIKTKTVDGVDEIELSEEEAFLLVSNIVEHFGWAGSLFTRIHVEHYANGAVSDEEWDKIKKSDHWQNIEVFISEAEPLLWEAVDEVLGDDEEPEF